MKPSTPQVGDTVQDTIGHWYRVIEVQADGWRFKVDQLCPDFNGTLRTYGYRPIVMGRSDFKFSQF